MFNALLASTLLLASVSHAQAPPPSEAPTETSQSVEELQATVDELRRAEVEAQNVRSELVELRRELEALREARQPESVAAPNERVGFGQAVVVGAEDEVDEVVGFGDDVHIHGTVLGDATSFGGSVVVYPSGIVHGDAVAFGGDVRVEAGGQVQGGRVSLGVPGVALPEDRDAAAMGSVSAAMASDASSLLSTLYRRLVMLLSFAGAGVLVVGLMPNRVTRIASTLEQHPFRSFFVGMMATGFLSLFSVLFALITLGLGSPVSLVVVALLGLAWLLGFVGLCQAVGDRLPFESKPHGRWLAFLVGTILMTCVGSLPLVGWLVVLAASTLGIGAALSSRFGGR